MDIVAAVVAHLRADSTLVTLLGASTRINREFIKSTDVLSTLLPQVYVSTSPGGDDDNPASSQPRVSIWAESKKAATCAAIQARIRVLLHEASYYTLGSSPNTLYCIRSMRGGPPTIEKREDNGAYESQCFYSFNVNES